jgi:hypothetical protein
MAEQRDELMAVDTGDIPAVEAELDRFRAHTPVSELSDEEVERRAKAIDPDAVDIMDDVALKALEMREQDSTEAEVRIAALFEGLTPKQKHKVLSSYNLARKSRVGRTSPRWVDWKAVPGHLHLHWISERLEKEQGWGNRGYRPVMRSKRTQKWVPNVTHYGTNPVIRSATYWLGVKTKREWLADQAQHLQTVEVNPEEQTTGVSAFGAVSGELGLAPADAARLDQGSSGLVITRGPGPEPTEEALDADAAIEALRGPKPEAPGVDQPVRHRRRGVPRRR